MTSKAKAEWIAEIKEIYEKKPVLFRPRIFFTRVAGIWKGAATLHFFIIINPALKEAIPEARQYLMAHEYGHIYKGHFYKVAKMAVSLAFFSAWIGVAWLYVHIYLYFFGIFVLGSLFYYFDKKDNRAVIEDEADNFALNLKGSKTMYKGCYWVGKELNDLDNEIRKEKLEKFKRYEK